MWVPFGAPICTGMARAALHLVASVHVGVKGPFRLSRSVTGSQRHAGMGLTGSFVTCFPGDNGTELSLPGPSHFAACGGVPDQAWGTARVRSGGRGKKNVPLSKPCLWDLAHD